jgi:hypothetical protein
VLFVAEILHAISLMIPHTSTILLSTLTAAAAAAAAAAIILLTAVYFYLVILCPVHSQIKTQWLNPIQNGVF